MFFSRKQTRPLSATAVSFLLAIGALVPASAEARETSVYSGTGQRPASMDGGNYLNGNDIRIEADTNCAWVYLNTDTSGPAFWSNNVYIAGTGFNSEKGGALRFGQGATNNTNPMIWTGNVTLIGDATIGVQTKTPNAVGIISGKLSSANDANKLLIRSRTAGSTAGTADIAGILTITSDNPDFNSPIQVGGGTLQLGDIREVTATGYEWIQNADGSETYTQNTAKQFTFDGTTGSVGSAPIDLTSVWGDKNSHLIFKRSGNVTVQNAISGTGTLTFAGTANYSLGENGSIANTLESVAVSNGATFVNCFNATDYSNQNGEGHWDYAGAVSGDGRYQVDFTTEAKILENNTRITISSIPASVKNFSGVYIFGAGYRFNVGSGMSQEKLGYALGATDYGQLWFDSASDSYTGDLYLKGNGWGTTEYFGAIRFAGGISGDLATSANMPSVHGNIYLMGDTRIQLEGSQAALITSNIQNDAGVDSAQLEVRRNRLIFTGNASHTQTVLASGATLQVGHIGTLNGTQYDGTSGSLGSGAVTVASGTTLHFMRSDAVTVAAAIANSGTIIFDGGGEYTVNSTIGGKASVTEETWVTLNQTTSATWSGAGSLQLNDPAGDKTNAMPGVTLDGFTGTLYAGTGYRWQTPTTDAPQIGAVDGGQIWHLGGVISKPIYLEGIGWHSGERFGALRFAAGNSTDAAGNQTMTGASSDIYLLGDTRISARNNNSPTTAILSGPISGDFQLEVNSSGTHGTKVAGTIILTGANTYGDTLVSEQDTLQVGHIGTINGTKYDGSTGTLGTGSATVAQNAKLVFMRSGEVVLPNELKGEGTAIFDGTASYTAEQEQLAGIASVQVQDAASLLFTGTIDSDVTQNVTGNGTLALKDAVLSVELSGENSSAADSPEAALIFGKDLEVLGSLMIDVGLEAGFVPGVDETLYLVQGTTESFAGLEPGDIQIAVPELSGLDSWSLGLVSLGDGMALALGNSVGTGLPEPSAWALLILGSCGIFFMRRRRGI